MKLLYKLLLWVAIATTALPAAAYDFMTGGLCYNINADGNTVTVSAYGNNASGSLNIPSSVNYSGKNYKVTAIGNGAFLYSGSTFTGSLTIPNSVTSIGENAFYYCDGLTGSLTIPNSVTSIGKSAFGNCSGFTGSLTIPNSVTAIGSEVFRNCSGFTGSLTIPNSVTSIGEYAFNGCSGFKGSLTIPNSVTSIGSSAFSGCSGFTGSLTIPNSVTSIGMWAFANCSGFTSINNYIAHPTNVTLGSWAFQGMSTSTCTLYVPRGTVTEYSQADQWKKFTTILEGSWGNVFVTSVTVSPSTSTLTVGGTATLTATVAPSNATNKNVTWTTSNSSVATISTNGTTCTVTAKAAGTATITCTAQDGSGKKGTCTVTVTQPVTSVTVSPSTSTLTVGSTKQLTATVSPSNATNKNVTWSTSNTAVATVSSSGLVTAVAAGTATIIATTADGTNLSATCAVTVTQPVTGITVSPTTATLEVGGTTTLTATVAPSNATNPTVTWGSSDENVATVDQDGMVTAIAPGQATITATTTDGSNLSASCAVTVNAPQPASVSAPALTVTQAGELMEIPITLTMPQGDNFTDIQLMITFPEGLAPAADEDGYYGYCGDGITRQRGIPVVTFSDNFDEPERWPNYTVVGANVKKVKNSTNPCHVYTMNVAAMPGYEPGERDVMIYVKYVDYDRVDHTVGTPTEKVVLTTVTFVPQGETTEQEMLVQVGYGTDQDEVLPIQNWWLGSYVGNEVLYLKDELGMKAGDKITALSYQCVRGSAYGGEFNVRIKNTTAGTLSETGALPTSASQLAVGYDDHVSGHVTLDAYSAGDWITLTLDEPFVYTGDNIVVDIRNSEPGSRKGWVYFAFTVHDGYRSIAWRNAVDERISAFDETAVDPYGDPDWGYYGYGGHVPNTRFSYLTTTEVVAATELALNKSVMVLAVGDSEQLIATVQPDVATNKTVVWSSNNPSVAHVDRNGVVTSVGSGLASIIAQTTDGSNLVAVCTVRVCPRGDINLDGIVDVTDVNILINIVLGNDDAASYGRRPYITGDDVIDISDVNALINILLGN